MISPHPPASAAAASFAESATALILVGHGSRRPGGLDSLNAHATALRRPGRFAEVHVAALRGGGDEPAAVYGRLRVRRAFVVPMMMCDGQTVRRELPAAFAAAAGPPAGGPELIFCPPVGTHPDLAALIAERAAAAAIAAGRRPAATRVLLIGHGSSRLPASAAATEQQAQRLRRRRLFAGTAVAFLEQEPRLDGVLAALPGPVIAVGLFAGAGRHAAEDVAAAMAACGRPDVYDLGPIGTDRGLVPIILATVATAAQDRASGAAPGSRQTRR
ncbi:MAG: hypothetical protein MUE49_09965 [Rhodospirillales bacterium]|nr:hypothetical protein [Rhodospirillales bacterium]